MSRRGKVVHTVDDLRPDQRYRQAQSDLILVRPVKQKKKENVDDILEELHRHNRRAAKKTDGKSVAQLNGRGRLVVLASGSDSDSDGHTQDSPVQRRRKDKRYIVLTDSDEEDDFPTYERVRRQKKTARSTERRRKRSLSADDSAHNHGKDEEECELCRLAAEFSRKNKLKALEKKQKERPNTGKSSRSPRSSSHENIHRVGSSYKTGRLASASKKTEHMLRRRNSSDHSDPCDVVDNFVKEHKR